MLRLLTLSTALCACLAAQAASSSFHSATGEIHITEIGITGDPTRYRDVVLRLTGPSPVSLNDPRATTFSRAATVSYSARTVVRRPWVWVSAAA